MRLISTINGSSIYKRAMIYSSSDGVFLFLYDKNEDSSANEDYWFEEIDDAMSKCKNEYNIALNAWEEIDDPCEFCQHDWINPVRVLGKIDGKPQWGSFEKLIDGEWKLI